LLRFQKRRYPLSVTLLELAHGIATAHAAPNLTDSDFPREKQAEGKLREGKIVSIRRLNVGLA
jgi:hypothetical protein